MHGDDDLKVPALPNHTPRTGSQKTQKEETAKDTAVKRDHKIPAASAAPGAVAVGGGSGLDPAAVKQAAARDPSRLSYASGSGSVIASGGCNSSTPAAAATIAEEEKEEITASATKNDSTLAKSGASRRGSRAVGAVAIAGIGGGASNIETDISHEEDRGDDQGATAMIIAELAPTDDEVMKRFVEDIPVAEADVAPSQRRWYILGGIGVLALAGLGAGLGVALSGSDSSPTPPPPLFSADTCIEIPSNPGFFLCYKENFPYDSTTTVFLNCPTNDEEQVFNCESCSVAGVSDINAIDDDTRYCVGCIICEDAVSFDCTNLVPGEECALQTCSGNCGKDPVPEPSPETQPDLVEDDGVAKAVAKEGIPFDSFVTFFDACPSEAETNVYECQRCLVIFEDSIADIIEKGGNVQTCSGCINCGDSLAYDCSNLFPGEECAAVDCDGTCVGDRLA